MVPGEEAEGQNKANTMRLPCHVATIDGEGLQFTAASGGSDGQEKGQLNGDM